MLNTQQINSLKPQSSIYRRGIGNGLSIVVYPTGRKYFNGRIKRKDFWVGTYGNKGGELTLAEARDKFKTIKDYCYKNEVSYADYKRKKEKAKIEEWDLNEAITYFLNDCKNSIKETTLKENTRKLKRVLFFIDGKTPLLELEKRNGGKGIIEDVITKIEVSGRSGNAVDEARRCRNLLKQVFFLAEDLGKMEEGQNPAFRRKPKRHKVTHHPTIDWEEVPEVLEKVSLNPSNSHPITQLAIKLTFMTFLRSGAFCFRSSHNFIPPRFL